MINALHEISKIYRLETKSKHKDMAENLSHL